MSPRDPQSSSLEGPPTGTPSGEAPTLPPHDPKLPRTFHLGEFNLRNFRPTHNEIASLKFAVHVVLPPGTTDETMREFEHWKRRLRDQAITAIRSASPDDLADPKLHRVHRLLYLRLKRVPTPKAIHHGIRVGGATPVPPRALSVSLAARRSWLGAMK